ncbi:hypothetical protein TGRUB_227880 [Toxoplasma gondii RUB]|uniref:Uncharacterized protein n=1 Tax=Toxoplasma gondii RUB TaxID=935652 RepID=A0A086M9R6_TOXGO|nr:hypothetical protein TGRUB_227880 [Toxoplasma gondii RUB]
MEGGSARSALSPDAPAQAVAAREEIPCGDEAGIHTPDGAALLVAGALGSNRPEGDRSRALATKEAKRAKVSVVCGTRLSVWRRRGRQFRLEAHPVSACVPRRRCRLVRRAGRAPGRRSACRWTYTRGSPPPRLLAGAGSAAARVGGSALSWLVELRGGDVGLAFSRFLAVAVLRVLPRVAFSHRWRRLSLRFAARRGRLRGFADFSCLRERNPRDRPQRQRRRSRTRACADGGRGVAWWSGDRGGEGISGGDAEDCLSERLRSE